MYDSTVLVSKWKAHQKSNSYYVTIDDSLKKNKVSIT